MRGTKKTPEIALYRPPTVEKLVLPSTRFQQCESRHSRLDLIGGRARSAKERTSSFPSFRRVRVPRKNAPQSRGERENELKRPFLSTLPVFVYSRSTKWKRVKYVGKTVLHTRIGYRRGCNFHHEGEQKEGKELWLLFFLRKNGYKVTDTEIARMDVVSIDQCNAYEKR